MCNGVQFTIGKIPASRGDRTWDQMYRKSYCTTPGIGVCLASVTEKCSSFTIKFLCNGPGALRRVFCSRTGLIQNSFCIMLVNSNLAVVSVVVSLFVFRLGKEGP